MSRSIRRPPRGRAAARCRRGADRGRGGRARLEDAALEQALARLDAMPVEAPRAPATWRGPASTGRRRRCGRTWPARHWQRVFGGFDEIRLGLRGDTHRVSLLRLAPARGCRCIATSPTSSPSCCRGLHRQHRQLRRRRLRRRAWPAGARAGRRSGRACIALIVVEKPIVLTGMWRASQSFSALGWM
jgi:putative transcriptional regulator